MNSTEVPVQLFQNPERKSQQDESVTWFTVLMYVVQYLSYGTIKHRRQCYIDCLSEEKKVMSEIGKNWKVDSVQSNTEKRLYRSSVNWHYHHWSSQKMSGDIGGSIGWVIGVLWSSYKSDPLNSNTRVQSMTYNLVARLGYPALY